MLIEGIDTNPRAAAIVRSIVALCHGLGLQVAEEESSAPASPRCCRIGDPSAYRVTCSPIPSRPIRRRMSVVPPLPGRSRCWRRRRRSPLADNVERPLARVYRPGHQEEKHVGWRQVAARKRVTVPCHRPAVATASPCHCPRHATAPAMPLPPPCRCPAAPLPPPRRCAPARHSAPLLTQLRAQVIQLRPYPHLLLQATTAAPGAYPEMPSPA